ncbi:uncharacterized protein LOC106074468 [Biomphalaria glabrata]|uniref:Uncharacterized protein LOC106074468 n=1 Tax=Biomphalaria glabrata TaxID=6526 RepID=A0A9U8EK62_BIOGL|nr:uncharacterized protein LOC106074468 [Biomphalaria glabrata]XP_013090706.2 uncharacterized protein LOC106074468 [Biomphalaria glabrata]XP_013090707.2 uncharacterized protein LOC106074468 [Biomphalaria glabrata]XP_013090708.2 uncharacterized protein LOC106074468 [Biomphalaria glabrata]XP_013090709.2 uncharacterized protein LOC106074468 [Biomphalaria glabrata]
MVTKLRSCLQVVLVYVIVVTGLMTSNDTSLNVYFDIVTPDLSSSQEDNVTLQCQVLGITLDSDIKVAEYTIFFHQLNQWQTLAQISQGSDHVTSKDGTLFLTKGSTGTALDPTSFIQLTWRRSDFDIADDYRCDVTYYTSDSRESQKVFSKILSREDIFKNLKESPVKTVMGVERANCDSILKSKDIVFQKTLTEIIMSFNASIQELVDETKQLARTNSELIEYLATTKDEKLSQALTLLENSSLELASLKEMMQEKLQRHTVQDVTELEEKLRRQEILIQEMNETLQLNSLNGTTLEASVVGSGEVSWPKGTYALLKPNTGCPTNAKKSWLWKEGYRKYHTESSGNADKYSDDIHLALPVKVIDSSKHFVYLSFCAKDSNYGSSSHWPIGSYCINRVGRHCPAGFKSGGFRINEEKNYYSGTVGGFLLETGPNFYLRFCCRADGSPTTPIILPNGSPFYLSKFGNLCQEVYGMTSTEEYIYLDTDDSNNEDMAFPPHPEGFANNGFQMWMCYYKPN